MANYKIVEVELKSVKDKVLIYKIPKADINDKLTYFTRERGLIAKSLYEDFLIATCIANIQEFLDKLKKKGITSEKLLKIRTELVDKILKVNPMMSADNLVINKNNVVKIKDDEEIDECILLIDNEYWDRDVYTKSNNKKRLNKDKIGNIQDLPHVKVQKFWKRIGQYITIKQFDPGSELTILGNRNFTSRHSFEQYIVTVCIHEVEDLFIRLDMLGLPNRVAPPILIHELYEICKKVNPFLDYDLYKDSFSTGDESVDPFANMEEAYANPEELLDRTLRPHSKHVKTFRDIESKELLKLDKKIKKKVIGQNNAVDDLVEAIQRASVGLKDPDKPIGAFLFTGRTGIGKSYCAKVLAEELIGNKRAIVVIDCSEYAADHEYAKLIGCFVPGTKVLMDDGSLKNIENVKVGDRVISHTGQVREVKNTFEYEQNGEMLQISVANSNVPIITTKGHEILAIRHKSCTKGESREYRVCKPTCSQKYCVEPPYKDYKLEWIPAEELRINDIVVYPRYKTAGEYPSRIDLVDYLKETKNYKYDDDYVWAQKHVKVPRYVLINEDFMRLAGYYVSEGGASSSGGTVNFTFNVKEINYVIEVIKLIRKIFGQDVRIRIEDRSENNSYRIYISSRIISILMSDLFGENTYKKQVPNWFINLPNDHLINFLETAIFGDGCTTIPRRVDYSTVSLTLFSQMQLMFRKLGYITYASLEKKSNPKHSDRYRLYIGGNQIDRLLDEFAGLNIDLKDLGITNIQRKAWIDDNYIYLQIKNIKSVNYKGKVYDLQVDTDTSYVVGGIGGITVHNSPAGYVGHEQGGYLTNAVRKNPFSIVLFDEVEKASDRVHQLMLQIMDEGRLTDGKGKPTSFKDVVVIMTSNLGVEEAKNVEKTIGFGDVNKLTSDKQKQAIDEALKKKFKPEFLNRITRVINFNDLTKKDYLKIIKLELEKLKTNLKLNRTIYSKLKIEFDKSVYNYIYEKGIDEEYGARPLLRAIEKEISTPLAKKLLREHDRDWSRTLAKISIKSNELNIELHDIEKEHDSPPFYMEATSE